MKKRYKVPHRQFRRLRLFQTYSEEFRRANSEAKHPHDWNTLPGRRLIRILRLSLHYSRRTPNMDIFYTNVQGWKAKNNIHKNGRLVRRLSRHQTK
jgi:hypothetical protein